MRTVKRIIKIHKIEGYLVYCLFNTGESRIIDFNMLFDTWRIDEDEIEYSLKHELSEFQKVKLVDGTLSWKNITQKGVDENGAIVEYPYQIDPIVLYENSIMDESRELELGMLIKQTRKELGLTQAELAGKSGTTKHYISKLENNRIGIEISTLKRIIEGGFGKRMEISIV